jgi:hypothetical protein
MTMIDLWLDPDLLSAATAEHQAALLARR